MSENNQKKRRFLQGTAVLVATLAGGLGANAAEAATSHRANFDNPQAQPEFIISPSTAPGAQEYQHESHSSHQSHASHASHSSHYSNAG
jgi:hypothetical protein